MPPWPPPQQSECDQFYADCAAEYFCFGTARATHSNNAASFWGVNTTCSSEATGCQRMDEIFTSGTQMCLELWHYGDNVNAFTVVPTDQETATNSFSLLGGATMADDLFSIPATLENPNDQVLLLPMLATSVLASALAAIYWCLRSVAATGVPSVESHVLQSAALYRPAIWPVLSLLLL